MNIEWIMEGLAMTLNDEPLGIIQFAIVHCTYLKPQQEQANYVRYRQQRTRGLI